eukprot:scaffold298_cov247-Pinguiococcus_pyrenoidosus.AAC.41
MRGSASRRNHFLFLLSRSAPLAMWGDSSNGVAMPFHAKLKARVPQGGGNMISTHRHGGEVRQTCGYACAGTS